MAFTVLGADPALGTQPGRPAAGRPNVPQAQAVQAVQAVQAKAAKPKAASPGSPGRRRSEVGMVVESISPQGITPSSKISISGYLQNSTNQPLAGVTVRLKYSQRPLASRGELAQQAGADPPPLVAQTAHPRLLTRPLAPGARQAWRLATTSKELGFRTFGVYPLSVEASDATGRVLGAQRTSITFVPKDYEKRLKPTKVAWVWPLMDVPHRTIDSAFRDDRLAASFAAGGRLNGLVAAARSTKTPLTWAIDPALLDDARTMTRPYTVKDAARPKSAAAERWLADVKVAVGGQTYFATPYADPDVTALVRRGRTSDIKYASSAEATEAARSTFGRPPAPIAWPPDGVAGQDTLNQLSRLGTRVFLLSSDILPSAPALTYTPSAAIALPTSGGTKYAVAGDRPISSVIGADLRAPGAEVLAEQRFLAETALITAERPSLQRTVLIVPPRRWNPSERFAQRLLSDTSAARWLQPVTMDEVTRSATAQTGTAVGDSPTQRTFAGYPVAYQARELSAGYLKSVKDIQSQALRFASIFDPPLTGFQQGVLRLESSALRGKRAAGRARSARNALRAELGKDIKNVHFVLNKGPRMAGEIGQVPITIANDVPGHTLTVYLEVTSAYPAKLQIGKFPSLVKIPPNKKVTIQIPMKAAANGKTDVRLALLTPQKRRPIGIVRQMQVNATGFGQTALLITGGALAVLFLAVGFRVARARRRNQAEGGDELPANPPVTPVGPGQETIAGADHEARA